MSSFGHLTNLDPGKLQDLETVLTAILALPITRDTLAQVIEGRPTRTPFSDEIKNAEFKFDKTIIVGDNVKPGHQAMRQFDEFKTAFALKDLILELKLVQSYEKAPQGSREYVLHLLKIAAASVHALAGSLYASSHKDMVIKPPEPEGGHSRLFDKTDEFYVNFYHTNYQLFEKYPFGLLNVVGYWAEAEIFGGVVLFEHEEGLGITEAFVHPQKTPQAFQLSEKQLQCFTDLRRPGDAARKIGAETLLPFVQEPTARTELIVNKAGEPPPRIYKNEYDQPPVSLYPMRRSCVVSQLPVSVSDAMEIVKNKGWLELYQGRAHQHGTLPVSPSTGKNTPLSTYEQLLLDQKGP